MKVAYFDCQFGAAGDMLLGALVAAQLPIQPWLDQVSGIALPPGSFQIKIEDVVRCTIASKKVEVICQPSGADEERNLKEINQIIEKSAISDKAKSLSRMIFQNLAEAEGSVHGIDSDRVHFHEVGAVDSIVDIIGFAVAYDLLNIEKSFVSPLPLGGGTVQTRHGLLPVPGPAVLALLAKTGARILESNYKHECLTPTGAAILTTIATAWGNSSNFDSITAIGYGAGTFNPNDFPNACRVILGEAASIKSRFRTETIAVLETNLDDLSPEILAFATEQLLKTGALDVFVTPCIMKKGRSGQLLTILCLPSDSERIEAEICLQTSTLGVRKYLAERSVLEREWATVNFNGGQPIRIKVARDTKGNIINTQPEYEDCAAAALSSGLPIKEVFKQALAKFKST